jgi:hypothetical protein
MAKYCIYDDQIGIILHALEAIPDKSTDKKKALDEITRIKRYYAIAGMSKEDISGKLFNGNMDNADLITDQEIEDLAGDMENTYLESEYWLSIAILGENIKERIVDEKRKDQE